MLAYKFCLQKNNFMCFKIKVGIDSAPFIANLKCLFNQLKIIN